MSEQAGAPGTVATIEGDVVNVCWGEDRFSPVQYNSFSVGPIFYRTNVKPDETPEQALERALAFVHAAARRLYLAKRDAYFWALDDQRQVVKGQAGGNVLPWPAAKASA